MKVRELIEELKTYNPDAEITTPFSETIGLSYISDKGKENAEIVFIEWKDYVDDGCCD